MKYVYYSQPYIVEYLYWQLWNFYPFLHMFWKRALCVCSLYAHVYEEKHMYPSRDHRKTSVSLLIPFYVISLRQGLSVTLPLKYPLGWLASNPYPSSCLVHHSDRWSVSEGTSCFYIGPGIVSSGFYDSLTSILTCSDISPDWN